MIHERRKILNDNEHFKHDEMATSSSTIVLANIEQIHDEKADIWFKIDDNKVS